MSDAAARKVTVYDIARRLGLSPSTVSRALDESELIGADTRTLVLGTAEQMGYRRRVVRRPESRSIQTIKLYIPESRDAYVHLFYDVAELIDGIQQGFADVRINILTCLNDDSQVPFSAKKTTMEDAAVFAFTEAGEALYGRYRDRNIPVIHINRIRADRNYVAVDNYLGMETLLRSVAAVRPAVRPCFIGFAPVAYISRERRAGLLGAASKMGIPFGHDDCFEFRTIADLDGAFVHRLVREKYDALFCFNDLVAVYVYNRAVREGLRVPEDFCLTGFDNAPVLDLAPKRIDTVEFSIRKLGFQTGAFLRRRLMERSEEELRMTLAGDYVAGETIAPAILEEGR